MSKPKAEDKQRSGTKDITLDTAKQRLRGRAKQIEDAINGAQGIKARRKNQSTDSNQ